MTKEEIEKYTWDFLKSKQLADEVSSAIMGNIEAESEFNPSLVEVGTSIGFGLCQWSFERRERLEAYGTSLDHQLNFLWAELTGGDSSIGANNEWIPAKGYDYNMFITNQYSIDEATKAFCWCWERPNEALAHIDRRIKSAYYYYELFKGSGGGEVEPPTPPTKDMYVGKVWHINSNYFYMQEDSLFGRKFTTNRDYFFCYSRFGNKATIIPGNLKENTRHIVIKDTDEEGNEIIVDEYDEQYYTFDTDKRKINIHKRHLKSISEEIEELDKIPTGGSSLSSDGSSGGESSNADIEKYVQWAIDIANDDSHGYSQPNRWSGVDYDCSSFVITALHQAGFNIELDGYTETMVTQLPNAGFTNITSQIDMTTGSGLIRGDVLLNHKTHTAIYIGNGQMVDARIDEVGGIQGAQMGDQTGEEIMVHNYNNHPWTHVFRYSK